MLTNDNIAKDSYSKVFLQLLTERSRSINMKNVIVWTSDFTFKMLKNWNYGQEFNPCDLESFGEALFEDLSVIFKAMEYIANASNSALICNGDYLLSDMDVFINVKWIGGTGESVNNE